MATMSDRTDLHAAPRIARIPPGGQWLWRLLPVAVAAAVIIAFSPTFSNAFVWDDHAVIEGNEHLRSLSVPSLAWMFTTTRTGPYQPLAWLSLAVDHKIWGLSSCLLYTSPSPRDS